MYLELVLGMIEMGVTGERLRKEVEILLRLETQLETNHVANRERSANAERQARFRARRKAKQSAE